MGQALESPSPTSRRVFIRGEVETFQLFSLSQNTNDGSIYFSAPKFEEMECRVPVKGGDQQPVLLSYQAGSNGKLSLHGTGVTHVRPHDSPHPNEFAVRGNSLRDRTDQMLGVRHLLTIYPSEPKHKPNSPAMGRQSDYVITTTKWHPYVIVFWAVPANRQITVTVNGSFDVDDLEEVPPNAGWGSFTLALHAIIWFAYRTKHMTRWPRRSQACYGDGHTVPLFIGTGVGEFRLEYRQPTYSLADDQLTITL